MDWIPWLESELQQLWQMCQWWCSLLEDNVWSNSRYCLIYTWENLQNMLLSIFSNNQLKMRERLSIISSGKVVRLGCLISHYEHINFICTSHTRRNCWCKGKASHESRIFRASCHINFKVNDYAWSKFRSMLKVKYSILTCREDRGKNWSDIKALNKR